MASSWFRNPKRPVYVKFGRDRDSLSHSPYTVGACGISGGIFGETYAFMGGVDKVIPVDVYIPGCPPFYMGFCRNRTSRRKTSPSNSLIRKAIEIRIL